MSWRGLIREGRSPQQIGRKGLSNHRWIIGGKLCLLLNQWGLIVGWACATANVADNTLLTVVCHFKKVMHRVWAYFQARLAFTMALFNVLVQWHGFQRNASGFVPLSIAEFSLYNTNIAAWFVRD